MKIESTDIDVEALLAGSYFFIPRFQRPYSWDDENISEFWEDLVNNTGENYFIGSMVVYRRSKQLFGVVDGQQRLTTITIFLCALREAFRELGDVDRADGLHSLIERKDRENKDTYVLKPETSFPYFQEHILKEGKPEFDIVIQFEEERLAKASEIFNSKLSKM